MKADLDPEALEQIEFYRNNHEPFCGPIIPRALLLSIPRRGPYKVWSDMLPGLLLVFIIDAYRLAVDKDRYWRGPFWTFNRTSLAKELSTTPDHISAALSWLVELGLVGRKHVPLHDDSGKTYTQRTYVWPIMAAIAKLLTDAKEGKSPERPVKPRRNHDPKYKNKSVNPESVNPGNGMFTLPETAGSHQAKRHVHTTRNGRYIPNAVGRSNEVATPTTTGVVSPSALPSVAASPRQNQDAQKFIKAFQVVFPVRWPGERMPSIHSGKLQSFFEQQEGWTPAKLLLVTVCAWGMIGKTCKNANGVIYRYRTCFGSKKPEHVIKHFDQILSDIGFPTDPEEIDKEANRICNGLNDQVEIDEEVFAQLCGMLQEIFRSNQHE